VAVRQFLFENRTRIEKMVDDSIEKANLPLEERRFELEKARLALEGSFSKKYAAALIGVLGAIVAGIFALAQIQVASITKEKELESARLEHERRWKLDVADFVFRNRETIFSTNETEQRRIRNVMVVTFPYDITKVLFEKLEAAVPEEQKSLWQEGQKLLVKVDAARVFIHYTTAGDEASSQELAHELRSTGYNIPRIELVKLTKKSGDIRYYYDSDFYDASRVKEIVEKYFTKQGKNLNLSVQKLSGPVGQVSPKTIEVWLPNSTSSK
jgi:hypothetical protein